MVVRRVAVAFAAAWLVAGRCLPHAYGSPAPLTDIAFQTVAVDRGWVRQGLAALERAGLLNASAREHCRRAGAMSRFAVAVVVQGAFKRRDLAAAGSDPGRAARRSCAELAFRRFGAALRDEAASFAGTASFSGAPSPSAAPFLRSVPPACRAAARLLRTRQLVPEPGHWRSDTPGDALWAERWRLTMVLNAALRRKIGTHKAVWVGRNPPVAPEVEAVRALRNEFADDLRLAYDDWDAWIGSGGSRQPQRRSPELVNAISHGDIGAVRFLLEVVGVDPWCVDAADGEDSLDLARRLGRPAVVRLLAKARDGSPRQQAGSDMPG